MTTEQEVGRLPGDTGARGRGLRYEGYRSFGYLDAGTDYRPFRLASETDRVPALTVEVSDAEEARPWRPSPPIPPSPP